MVIDAKIIRQLRSAFPKIKARFDETRSSESGLICKEGFYKNCSVLKLQKACWTNDRIDRIQNETGIFFSIWIDDEAARNGRANYNIHALKLRELNGYSIASRDFAEDFRARFVPLSRDWPNVSVDYGPLTLMQGWFDVDASRFESDALTLMERFERLSPVIDQLLESRRTLRRRGNP